MVVLPSYVEVIINHNKPLQGSLLNNHCDEKYMKMVLFMAQLLDEILGELFIQLFLPNVLNYKVVKCTCLTRGHPLNIQWGKNRFPTPIIQTYL